VPTANHTTKFIICARNHASINQAFNYEVNYKNVVIKYVVNRAVNYINVAINYAVNRVVKHVTFLFYIL